MSKRKVMIIWILLLTLIWSACGKVPDQSDPQSSQGSISAVDHSSFDWREATWNSDIKKGPESTLYAECFTQALNPDIPGDYSNMYAVNGQFVYAISTLARSTEEGYQFEYYLSIYDTQTGTEESRPYTLPAIEGYEGMKLTLSAFEVLEDKDMILFIQALEENKNRAYLAVHVSAEGKVLSVTDLQPALVENGIELEDNFIFDNIHADSEGMYVAYRTRECLVLDEHGELVAKLGQDKKSGWYRFAFHTPDGKVVTLFQSENGHEDHLSIVSREKGEIVLAQGDIPKQEAMAMDTSGYLYYLAEDAILYRWDLISGDNQLCVDMKSDGISTGQSEFLMTLKTTAEPVLIVLENTKARIHATSFTPVERNVEEIRIVDLQVSGDAWQGVPFASASAARFVKERGDCTLQIETADQQGLSWSEGLLAREEFRKKKLNELIAGDIPDLFFINKEDFHLLGEKGMFADLSDVLSPETKSHIFASSQQGGVLDGKQYALIPEANATLVLVNRDIWDKDRWTFEEALNILEQNKQYRYLIGEKGSDSGYMLLLNVLLADLNNTPFLDLENGSCDFDQPLFLRLLKSFESVNHSYKSWDYEDEVYEKCIGFVDWNAGYAGYTLTMEQYDSQYRIVGIPTESGKGNYWEPSVYVAVSKDAINKQAVRDFLEYLFSVENQRYTHSPLRNDLLDQYAVYDETDPKKPQWMYRLGEGGVLRKFAWKPDGSSYASEYVECMEKLTYPSGNTEDIMKIVRDEVFGFVDGFQTAENTAKNIQKRVQLYLDEKQ